MINKTLKQVPNGEEYDTVYPATFDQNDTIVNQILLYSILIISNREIQYVIGCSRYHW